MRATAISTSASGTRRIFCKDRILVWLSKYHYVPLVVVGILLAAFGSLPFLLWGVFLRVTIGLHATWMVNSLTHFWGSRRFATRDDSRNNWFVALLSFGEGGTTIITPIRHRPAMDSPGMRST